MNGLLQTLAGLGRGRLIALGAVGIALIAFFAIVVGRMSQPTMVSLYSGLDIADSGRIVEQLEANGVAYQLNADGTAILVPQEMAPRLRMDMAAQGLPSGGSIGYELLDNGSGFGATSFEQQLTYLRALEGELARSIRTLGPIGSARVHLVMPKRELFSRDNQEPSASVIVSLRGAAELSHNQIRAILGLVASAVPKLSTSRISLIDDRGNLLAGGEEEQDPDAVAISRTEELQRTYETRLTRNIVSLLERSLGPGRVRAEVAADMNFDRITENAEIYDPEGQVLVSSETITETDDTSSGAQNAVSVTTNLPDQNDNNAAPAERDRSAREEVRENYENSRTVRTHVREAGTINRLSIAVLVDGVYEPAADGETAYRPRTGEELERLRTLVRSAVGFDETRGDVLEVVNMRFVTAESEMPPPESPLPLGLTKNDLLSLAEKLGFGILALLALLLVARPVIKRLLEASRHDAAVQAEQPAQVGYNAPAGALTGPAGASIAPDEDESMIDIDQVEGQVRASTIKRAAELVQRHPEEAVGIMRQWMYSDRGEASP